MKQNLLGAYTSWLTQDIYSMNRDENGLFTTPFLNPLNDCNQVRITYTDNNRIRISDEADTIFTITHEFGINLKRSPNKVSKFRTLLDMYFMNLEDNELVRYCDESEFPWVLHYFSIGIMAIQNVFSNLNIVTQNEVSMINLQLKEQRDLANYVETGFLHRKINFRRSVKKMGLSGFNHKYDFSFGESESEPSILMKAPNALRPDNTQLMLFEWEDYLKTAPEKAPFLFIVANDTEQIIDKKIIKLIVNQDNVVYCPISDEANWMEECRKRA